MATTFNIDAKDNKLYGQASLVRQTVYEAGTQSTSNAVLEDVQKLQAALEKQGAEADAPIEELRKAVEQNKPSKAKKIWCGLSDAVKKIAEGIAIKALLSWMGI